MFTKDQKNAQIQFMLDAQIKYLTRDRTYIFPENVKPKKRENGNNGNRNKLQPKTIEAQKFILEFLKTNPASGPKAIGEAKGYAGKDAKIWGEKNLRTLRYTGLLERVGHGKYSLREF